jgi:cob(I)alamin adenosyltransferase
MIGNEKRDKRHGLLINITGNGKGKTTSALGTSMRALGWGWKVTALQFVKDAGRTGEKLFADNSSLPFEIIPLGAGFTWRKDADECKDIECAELAWEMAKQYIEKAEVDLLVLDELNIALNKGWLKTSEVIDALKQRPSWMHVIITGRDAPSKIIEASDLVSEVQEIKHPFQKNIKAQKGIEF